jgi:hypothetical protein
VADDEGKTGGEGGEGGSDGEDKDFKPESLSKEAQEYIRREVQSKADSNTALVEKRLRDEQATRNRSAVEDAEQLELRQLAESGQHEVLGQRIAIRLTQRSVEEKAVTGASDLIEQQMADAFSESLGAEKVEEIRRKVVADQGAHAEFAVALAEAAGGKSRAEEIQAEVQAALIAAKVIKRDEDGGADQVSATGQGAGDSRSDKELLLDPKTPIKTVMEIRARQQETGE